MSAPVTRRRAAVAPTPAPAPAPAPTQGATEVDFVWLGVILFCGMVGLLGVFVKPPAAPSSTLQTDMMPLYSIDVRINPLLDTSAMATLLVPADALCANIRGWSEAELYMPGLLERVVPGVRVGARGIYLRPDKLRADGRIYRIIIYAVCGEDSWRKHAAALRTTFQLRVALEEFVSEKGISAVWQRNASPGSARNLTYAGQRWPDDAAAGDA